MPYLTLPSTEALHHLLLSHSGSPDLQANHLSLGLPVAVGDTLTEIEVGINPSTAPVKLWVYSEPMVFTYHRFDLESTLGEIHLTVDESDLPVMSAEVLTRITQTTGIPFDVFDIHALIMETHGTYRLEANPYSLKWVGSIPLILTRG